MESTKWKKRKKTIIIISLLAILSIIMIISMVQVNKTFVERVESYDAKYLTCNHSTNPFLYSDERETCFQELKTLETKVNSLFRVSALLYLITIPLVSIIILAINKKNKIIVITSICLIILTIVLFYILLSDPYTSSHIFNKIM